MHLWSGVSGKPGHLVGHNKRLLCILLPFRLENYIKIEITDKIIMQCPKCEKELTRN